MQTVPRSHDGLYITNYTLLSRLPVTFNEVQDECSHSQPMRQHGELFEGRDWGGVSNRENHAEISYKPCYPCPFGLAVRICFGGFVGFMYGILNG